MSFQNTRYALRALRKSPAMTMTALAALALGIGANTALFSVVHTLLLRPMNYPHPDRIVQLTRNYQGGKFQAPAVTAIKFDFWWKESRSFEAVAAHGFLPVGVNLAGKGEPERISSLMVTADFFRVLGVQPAIGRAFTASEDRPGAGHVAVISYALWQRRFNSDSRIVEQGIPLNNASYTVIGVMPRGFEFPQAADVWTPMQLKIDPADRTNNYKVIARLKPDVPLRQAAEDMRLVAGRFRRQFGRDLMDEHESIGVLNFHSWLVGNVRPALLVLMGAVAFVLLIACANVANLLLARSAARQHETAVRSALGASGWQLMRLLLTESLLLSLTGGVLGIVLAQASLPSLVGLAPSNLPLAPNVNLDWNVILFAAAISVTTGLLFGAFPAMQSAKFGIVNRLRDAGTRTTTSAAASRVRHALVIVEVAVSLVLLIGAALLIETFKNLSRVDPGFDTHHVLTTQMSLTDERFGTTAATARLAERVVRRLEALTGVAAVGTITSLPTEPGFDNPFEIIGRPASKEMPDESMRIIMPRYFAAMRIPVVAGRAFTENDTQAARRVIIINEAFARKYFPHENPLGQQILVGRTMGPLFADAPREIVGVVGNTRDESLGAPPQPIFFEPLAQVPDALMAMGNQLVPVNWVIRTSGDPLAMAEKIRRETLVASGDIPMAEPRLLEQVIGNSIARQRFAMTLLGIFAGLAMLLASIGLYGVISYSVAQRTRELGIRAALGAARGDLLKIVIGQGMWLVGIGLAMGLVSALGLTQFLKGMLYGVTAFNASVLVTVTGLLAAVALLACWLPARRAARVDPIIALREE